MQTQPIPTSSPVQGPRQRLPARLSARLLVLFAGMLVYGLLTAPASAQAWSLSKAQRQAYLQYYAPVILQRADEDNGKIGRDWLTNFDFDRDNNFSNNRYNWLQTPQYIYAAGNPASPYAAWKIRPTLYTALIEYMEGGSKSLVLLYHVYHASDKNGDAIHDWERLEIHIRGAGANPGGGEYVSHAIETLHTEHIIRTYSDYTDLNFMHTATGKHLMIWQADENGGWPNEREHELHYVQNPYTWISARMNGTTKAEADITDDDDKKNIHYVWVPESSSAAVAAWNAKPLTYATASTQYNGRDHGNGTPWYLVPRITYELQDIADLHVSSWQFSNWPVSWTSDVVIDVLLESPIVNETGGTEVPAGMQRFYLGSRDAYKASQTDGREGFIKKKWMWGNYSAERDSDITYSSDDFSGFEGLGLDSFGWSRGAVSGDYYSHGRYWRQHDYFSHSGGVNTSKYYEVGQWLVGNWYRPENGGFDGRWVQLFDDRPNYEPTAPLALSAYIAGDTCTTETLAAAYATGGQAPYSFVWSSAAPYSAANASPNYAYVYADTNATVTVTSADGQTRSQSVWFTPYCGQFPF